MAATRAAAAGGSGVLGSATVLTITFGEDGPGTRCCCCSFCWQLLATTAGNWQLATTTGKWQLVDLGGNCICAGLQRDCWSRLRDGDDDGSCMNCEVGCSTPHGVVVIMILGDRDAKLGDDSQNGWEIWLGSLWSAF